MPLADIEKPTVNTFTGEKLNAFPQKSEISSPSLTTY